MTETRDDHVTWLTQEAYDRLKAEMDYLSGPGRVEIAEKIESARADGDLRENGGYHAAKEEQGKRRPASTRSSTSWRTPRWGSRRAPRAWSVPG